jgi:hypothetical protein
MASVSPLVERFKSTSFLFNHFRASNRSVQTDAALACRLLYSKAKGGRHENQDEREGGRRRRQAVEESERA